MSYRKEKEAQPKNASFREKNAQPKKTFFNAISNIVGKVFTVFRGLAHLIYQLIEQAFRLLTFCFSLLVKLASSPTTPCVVAILAFLLVCSVAASQWFLIGQWLGKLMGITGVWGIGAGTAGVLLGVGINVYQLAPILWKIRQDIAKAYLQLGIDVENNSNAENPEERLNEWLNADYGILKAIRLVSYGLETALVIGYCYLATGLNFFAIVQAAISLLLPEKCLMLVASTISVLGSVQEQISKEAEDSTPEDHVYL